jgi:O-acetyl-ADP-ribose deacetylase (regulator of RNase III)
MPEPRIVCDDITRLAVDAIVNAANEALAPGGGVCGAIHAAAGPALAGACAAVAPCPTGDARITDGFDLAARKVIHAVGPVYAQAGIAAAGLLAGCYERSLTLAESHAVDSIAFPCIGTGIYGYPAEEAAWIALTVLTAWCDAGARPRSITCCCFGERDAELYRRTLAALRPAG